METVSLILISYFLFVFGLWSDLTHPLLTVLVSYYFFIPYRLIVENKRSWEFQQKNKLLTQVEELKTLDIRSLKGKEGSKEFVSELQEILTKWQSGFDIEHGATYSIGYLYGYADDSSNRHREFLK